MKRPRIVAGARILIGAAFLVFGISKLLNPGFLYGGLLLEVYKYGEPYDFYDRFVIQRYVLLRQTPFAYLIAIAEILLGASFLTGALVSLAALGGAFLMMNFAFALSSGHPGQLFLHIVFALIFLAMGRAAAGLKWGVDGWLVERVDERIILFPLRLDIPAYMAREFQLESEGPTESEPASDSESEPRA